MRFQLGCKKIYVVLSLIIVIILLFSFIKFKNSSGNDRSGIYTKEIYVLDYWDQKVKVYNQHTYKFIRYWKDIENEFQYNFKEYSDILTSGNSITNNFSIIRYTETGVKTLLKLPTNEALFPLTFDNKDNMYFCRIYYNDDKTEKKRVISKYSKKDNQLDDLAIDVGKLMDVSVIGKKIFFTSYNEKEQKYELYESSLTGKNEIKMIESNLEDSDIYNINEELYLKSAEGKLVSQVKEYPSGEITVAYKDWLLFLDVNENNSQDLRIYSIDSEKYIYKTENLNGYNLNGYRLTIFKDDSTKKVDLKSLISI
ncbi:hypothetical protein [Lysinibacillus sp. NPDC059133]|uniref:hypothetical protein n=1 Tax=Lysinibacillus sp. NPDC059133 TaxID=3346737 RepID=UPI0036CF9353